MFRASHILRQKQTLGRVTMNYSRRSRSRDQHSIPFYIWGTAGMGSIAIAYGYSSCLDYAPLTGRRRWIATWGEWERKLGDKEYQELLQQVRKDILPSSHPASITLDRVGNRIANAATDFAHEHELTSSYDTNRPYTYTVVRSETANAFVLPGNHVFVFTGLFRYVLDEDDLAVILGHELAHNLARHAGEKLSASIVAQVFARLSLLVDPSGFWYSFILPAMSLFRDLPNSRTLEMEADEIGLRLSTAACFDPRAAKRVFKAMRRGESNDDEPLEILSTHPSYDTRLEKLDMLVPLELSRWQDNGQCGHIRQQMSRARQAAALKEAHRNSRLFESRSETKSSLVRRSNQNQNMENVGPCK